MSAPAAKYSSPPAITMQRTAGSASQASSMLEQRVHQLGRERVAGVGPVELRDARPRRRARQRDRRRITTIAFTPVSGAADDQLLDLRGALVERRHARVAQVALDRVVVDVAGAAVHLDRDVGALRPPPRWRTASRSRSRVVFGWPVSFSQPARQTSPRAASVSTIMSASISCTSWKAAIGAAELLALLRVGDRRVERALADADAAGGDAVAARVERSSSRP